MEYRYETITKLNIRTRPGMQHDSFEVSPLPIGTTVEVLREQGSWQLVDVIGEVKGRMDERG